MMIVRNNFLLEEVFNSLRQQAINAPYIDWNGPDGQVYKRICIIDNKDVQEAIEDEFGPVDMLGMAFRLNYEGESPNQAIHTDVGWGTHALVLYLNDGDSGTAFWGHLETGEVRLRPNDLATYSKVRKDWMDVNKWWIHNFSGMEKNKAVIYESEMYHSRFPFEAFGTTPEDGRLILVAFFTPKNMEN